jgi:hypothetical protein
VDEVLDAKAAKRDAFAQFANIGHGFRRCNCPGGRRRFFPGEGFEGAGDDLLRGVVAAGAEVGGDELLTVRVEGQGERHAPNYHGSS